MKLPSMSAAIAAFLFAVPLGLAAQDARPATPQVVTSGQGEVRAAPDRATVSVGVQTRAATAAAATSENSRRQKRVIDALKALGVPAEQISTTGFSVTPETQYDRTGQVAPKTQSYLVSNVVTVELSKTDLVGPVVDGALGAGANDIRGLSFFLANADSARRAALAVAVGRARADAEVAAKAAGGSLGSLIELIASEFEMPTPRPMAFAGRAMAMDAVPIQPGQETVRASVTIRWQYLAGPPR